MMRYVVALAAIPVVVWSLSPRTAPPIVANAVTSEGVLAARLDDATFRARWRDVADLPPMREVIHEPLLLVSHETPMRERSIDAGTAHRRRSVVSAMASRPASLNICTRHGLRKVNYGKRWRCRR